MNKSELSEALAARTNLSKTQAAAVVDAIFDSESGLIASTIKAGDRVSITGFGTFTVKDKAATVRRNPKTGATVNVAAKRVAKFTSGKGLKETVQA